MHVRIHYHLENFYIERYIYEPAFSINSFRGVIIIYITMEREAERGSAAAKEAESKKLYANLGSLESLDTFRDEYKGNAIVLAVIYSTDRCKDSCKE